MGIDFASKVITYFKADTSDMEAGLKKLTGLEKEQQKAQLDAVKERNAGYDSWIKKLGETNQALELAGKAVNFAKDAFKAYADDLQLRSAAGTANIDKLKAASLGLRTEHELLSFAAKTQHGVFKLTEEQMITAQKAMVALTRAGFDQEEVTKKLTDALVKGKAEGLDDFGIAIKSTGSQVGDFNALMGALAEKASGVRDGTRTAAEGVQAVGVSMNESIDHIKQAVGELVVSLGPLLEALATAVELIAKAASFALGGKAPGVGAIGAQFDMQDRIAKAIAGGGSYADMFNRFDNSARGPRQVVNAYDRWNNDELGSVDDGALYTWSNGVLKKLPKPGKGRDRTVDDYLGGQYGARDVAGVPIGYTNALGQAQFYDQQARGRLNGIDLSTLSPYSSSGNEGNKSDFQVQLDEWKKGLEDLQKDLAAKREQSFLESTFGKLDDFNAYSTAFNMLTGSVTAAMDAWITGSMSTGQAIKKFLADSLKGLATQMAVESIKHGAYALGSLAFGDVAGATAHGAAAAEFAAGAIAAGVAAKSLGGSGSAAQAKGGGATGSSVGTSDSQANGRFGGDSRDHRIGEGSSQNTRPVVVVLGSSFDETTPRQRARAAQDAVDRALRERDE